MSETYNHVASKTYLAEWIKRHPGKMKEYNSKYRKKHPKRIKKSRDKFYRMHSKEMMKLKAEYYKNHPDKHKAILAISTHRRRGFIVRVTSSELEILLKQTKVCPQCGAEFSKPRFKTVDRINDAQIMTIQTIQIVCLKCNIKNSKRDKIEEVKR